VISYDLYSMCITMCVCEREKVCSHVMCILFVYACVYVREGVCHVVRSVCYVCMRVCVCARERESVCEVV